MLGIHGKPSLTKLKNVGVSFWCFLTILASHAGKMGWKDIFTFTIATRAVHTLHEFASVLLELIKTRENTRNAVADPARTRTSATAPTTDNQIKYFEVKATYFSF